MGKFFFYRREVVKKKLNEDGSPQMKVNAEEGATPEYETEVIVHTDVFNTDLIIRCHTVREGEIVVLLDDGHETTEVRPVLKNKTKKPPYNMNDFQEEKQRVYLQSEIVLKGEDVDRLYKTLGRPIELS